MRIAAVDLVSNTCFPALAAQELGFFKEEGLDAQIELVSQIGATRALREGSADAMIAGSVHDLLREFPGWEGAKLLVALSQGTPWLLTVRADLSAERGDLQALKGSRLTAAEGPDLVFKRLLAAGQLNPEVDVKWVHLPGSEARDVSFGVFAARGLEAGLIDGFWSNAMGSATAVASGAGKVHVDVRRGDDPSDVRHCTFAGLGTTDAFIEQEPEQAAAAVRAIVKAQKALRVDPGRAAKVGEGLFPADATELITSLVERDAPFYEPAISEEAVLNLNNFAQSVGHLPGPVAYEQVAAVQFRDLWNA